MQIMLISITPQTLTTELNLYFLFKMLKPFNLLQHTQRTAPGLGLHVLIHVEIT